MNTTAKTIVSILVVSIIVVGIVHLVDFKKVSSAANVLASFQNKTFATCLQTLGVEQGSVSIKRTDDINTDRIVDSIITYKNEAMCGSGGCVHELCVSDNDTYQIIPFSIASDTIVVLESITNGMHDLELDNNKDLQLKWNGTKYELENDILY